jgi:hypothetical protein
VLVPQVTITAEFSDARIAGSGGCNRYMAGYKTTGNSLKISTIASTQKACLPPVMEQETRFLTDLEGATQYSFNPRKQLEISFQTASGPGKLVFDSEGPAQGRSWLDQSQPTNWNRPGAAIPEAPRVKIAAEDWQRCQGTLRPATLPLDRALTQAGWRLYGPVQLFGRTAIAHGLSSFDGMCRPMGYQDFVFVDGKFAGTLSPAPMDARTDGSSSRIFLYRATELTAQFSRYSDSDALCCPSRTTIVSYQIQNQKGLPVVVPTAVSTSPNSQ